MSINCLVREYFRYYPDRIEELMTLLKTVDFKTAGYEHWIQRPMLYLSIKQSLQFLKNQRATRVEMLEDKLSANDDKELQKQIDPK